MSQLALANLLGVERKWVIRLEAGNPKAELGLVLRALRALDIRASLGDQKRSLASDDPRVPSSRLDEVFRRLERPVRK